MRTEDDFWEALKQEPDSHHTRLIFADWLEEQGDERAVGMRALGLRRVRPTIPNSSGFSPQYYHYINEDSHLLERFDMIAHLLRPALLPVRWCECIRCLCEKDTSLVDEPVKYWSWMGGWYGYFSTPRRAETVAALAFNRLPADHQSALLKMEVLV